MGSHLQMLAAFVLFMFFTQVHGVNVTLTTVERAAEKGAVCLDGSPAGYYFQPGYGDGVNNWLVKLMGGGWCWFGNCGKRSTQWNGSTKDAPSQDFGWMSITSSNQSKNPEFYNWNRVYVRYCDGASYFGDKAANENGIPLELRGSRIWNAIMEELLEKGMKNANNALLAGDSAGGLAAILHCDDFRALLPNASRLKCLSEAGFFIRANDIPYNGKPRDDSFNATVQFHDLTNFLPKDCTSRMGKDASLCFFPEYAFESVKTPLFILNSAFDFFQITGSWPLPDQWGNCFNNATNCTLDMLNRTKDFGSAFRVAVKKVVDNPSSGLFVKSCYIHDLDEKWNNIGFTLENKVSSLSESGVMVSRVAQYTFTGKNNTFTDKNDIFAIENDSFFSSHNATVSPKVLSNSFY